MTTTLTEANHAGEALLSEAAGCRSREPITVLSGQVLTAGQVISQVTKAGASAAAYAGNTGDGTMGAITVSAGAKVGVYKLTIIEPATDAGAFQVEDPDGIVIGTGDVASAFSAGGLAFTLADGATDFASGDGFDITVAAGSNKWVAYDQDATNGAETPAGVLHEAVDATSADADGVAYVRDCEVNGNVLDWPSDIDAGEKTAAIAVLKTSRIIVRT